jgi:cell wall-associated NlpC family hydrolase
MRYRHLILPLLCCACAAALDGCLPATRMARPGAGSAEAHRAVERSRSSAAITPDRRKVLDEAERWIGTPYSYGGFTRSGVDCSGFVCNVFGSVARPMPRTSSEQATTGESIALSQALPGDLVFFNTTGGGVSHVGILLDPDTFIHASTSNGVTVNKLSEPYYQNHFLFARRVLL